MNKVKIWCAKDEEGILRPSKFLAPREGQIANYVQPDIDKFLKRKGNTDTVVTCEVVEVSE